jgi:hypothetical protein
LGLGEKRDPNCPGQWDSVENRTEISVKFIRALVFAGVLAVFLPVAVQAHGIPKNCGFSGEWQQTPVRKMILCSPVTDGEISRVTRRQFESGLLSVEHFFQRPLPHALEVFLFPSRNSADEYWKVLFRDQNFASSCWMVATGVASRLAMLSTTAWPKEACDHDFTDQVEVQRLITHELVHSYHGQHNPFPEFDGLDSIGWFIEGLAVLVSGQLDAKRVQEAKTALAHKAPASLGEVWSGKHRYGLAGTLVKFVLARRGLGGARQLLAYTRAEQFLSDLGLSESELLERWRQWVLREL